MDGGEGRTPARERQAHWDAAYRDRGTTGVSWFQPEPTMSLDLIRHLGVAPDAAVLDVGGGASTLADALLTQGFRHLSVLDLSDVALAELRRRLGETAPVTLVHADVLAWTPEGSFDLWHDRAVFHFLVDDRDRQAYLGRLRQVLRGGGHVVLGTFAADGPQSCSGLPVARYSADALSAVLGPAFEIVALDREEHVTPAGVMQPFTWVAAQYRG